MTRTADKPTQRQLAYLRSLALKTGGTFVYPQTRAEASAEIDRLKGRTPSTAAEVRMDRRDVSTALAERPHDATRIRDDETTGYGSTAEWTDKAWEDSDDSPAKAPGRQLGRYTISSGDRVIRSKPVFVGVLLVDEPADGEGPSYVIHHGPLSLEERRALIADYIETSERRDEPGARTDIEAPGFSAPTELARYSTSLGERVIDGQRVDGTVRVTDRPANGIGASHLIARGLTKRRELDAAVAEYVERSERQDRPAGAIDYEEARDAAEARLRHRTPRDKANA